VPSAPSYSMRALSAAGSEIRPYQSPSRIANLPFFHVAGTKFPPCAKVHFPEANYLL